MKVIILNAGCGSRLGKDIPKGLVKLSDNTSILDMQLKHLLKNLDLNIDDINIVIGFKQELFKEKYDFLSRLINYNFKNTGPGKSLLTGFKGIEPDDVLWINGDVVFDDDTIKELKEHLDHNLILINGDLSKIRDEEYKISVNKDGYINEISRSNKKGIGYHIGINYIKKENFEMFKDYLEKSNDSDYFDVALQAIIDKGVKFLPLDIQNNFCMEIDHEDELIIAQNYILRK